MKDSCDVQKRSNYVSKISYYKRNKYALQLQYKKKTIMVKSKLQGSYCTGGKGKDAHWRRELEQAQEDFGRGSEKHSI